MGNIIYVVRIESPPILAPEKAKNLGKTSFVVRLEGPPILAPKKGKKFGQIKG